MPLSRFICADTEDNSAELLQAGKSGFNKKMTQIAAITEDNRSFHNRGNGPAFLDWLRKQPEKFIYFHNLKYDLGSLFADNLDVLDITGIGNRVIRALWEGKTFVDSFNIWPMSVKKLGPAFGLKKAEMDVNSKEYVFTDVEIILAAMRFAWQFCDNMGLASLSPTLGSLAIKLWKFWGGENVHDSNLLSREALYGGRVELFKRVNDSENVCWTDINSLYPAMMLRKFPGMLETQSDLLEWGIANVTIRQPRNEIVTLPFRREDGSILYPSGEFTGTWTIQEILEAEKNGAKIIKLHETIGTNESIKPYAEFVTRLYRARQASESEAEKLFFKLLMNNLYGRLGSSGVIERSVWQDENNRDNGIPYGQKVYCKYKMPLESCVNWCHAAYVTSYGRTELLKFIREIGSEQMIYCDTDSCIFDASKRTIPFATGTKLGQMKLVSWETNCETYAPKMYRCGNDYKAKGVPKAKAKTFIATGKAEFDLPFGLREAIRFFDRGNKRKLSVWRKVVKVKQSDYNKKTFRNNRFSPCHIRQVS